MSGKVAGDATIAGSTVRGSTAVTSRVSENQSTLVDRICKATTHDQLNFAMALGNERLATTARVASAGDASVAPGAKPRTEGQGYTV